MYIYIFTNCIDTQLDGFGQVKIVDSIEVSCKSRITEMAADSIH